MEIEIGRGKKARRAYGFDDVAIVPSRRTRDPDDVDISWTLGPYRFELPLLASAMDGVVSPDTAGVIGRLGGLAVLNLEGIWTRYEDADAILERMGRPPSALSEQTRALLAQYPWPGNVRELRNVVDQVVNLGEEMLPALGEAPGEARSADRAPAADLTLPFKEAKERLIEGFERDYLQGLIERCEGNVSRASRSLATATDRWACVSRSA